VCASVDLNLMQIIETVLDPINCECNFLHNQKNSSIQKGRFTQWRTHWSC